MTALAFSKHLAFGRTSAGIFGRGWSHDMVGRRRYGGVGRRSSFGLFVVSVGLILALYRVQRIVDGKMGHGVGTRLMKWIADSAIDTPRSLPFP